MQNPNFFLSSFSTRKHSVCDSTKSVVITVTYAEWLQDVELISKGLATLTGKINAHAYGRPKANNTRPKIAPDVRFGSFPAFRSKQPEIRDVLDHKTAPGLS